MTLLRSLLSLAAVLLFLGGCAAPPAKVRFVWPPPPDDPKLEFIGTFANDYDLKKDTLSHMEQRLFGHEAGPILRLPIGVVSDGQGAVYVSDTSLRTVVLFDFVHGKTEMMSRADLQTPLGMEIDSRGNIYVADGGNRKIYVFDRNFNPLRTIGSSELLKNPNNVALREDLGRLYVTDGAAHQIVVFDMEGNQLFTIGEPGTAEGQLFGPQGTSFDKEGNLFVADSFNARMQVFDADGNFLYTFGERGSDINSFENPRDAALDSAGNLYVPEGRRSNISIYNKEGRLLSSLGAGKATSFPLGFAGPKGIYIDATDRIYVVDQLNKRLSVWQYLNDDYLAKHPFTEADREALQANMEEARKQQEKEAKDAGK